MRRRLVRSILLCAAVVILFTGVSLAWLFLYSGDLPEIGGLRRYAPNQVTRVSDPCLGESTAVPYEAIGDNLRVALTSAEANEKPGRATVRAQISRTLFCAPSRSLVRELKEWRVAEQLRWRFSRNDLLTIYSNRAIFGQNLIGIDAGSEYFFKKEPNQLDLAEAALLAGLLKAPFHYSPYEHPDRALERRNEVIDAMVEDHAISAEEGAAAKAVGLPVAGKP